MFNLSLFLIAAAIVGLDRWTKHLVLVNIPLNAEVPLLPGVVHLTYLQNSGAAFSMLQGQRTYFVIITVLFLGAFIFLAWKKTLPRFYLILLACIAGGAVGNFIDRMAYGYVVDMIEVEFIRFAVFNVADVFITVGAILLVIYALFIDKSDKKPAGPEEKK